MATMKQVAEKARVSTTTVSHVINNTRVVSEDARERVLSVIQELRYIPSAVARSLKNDKTQTLGMMIPNNSNPYFAEVIQGIEDESFRLGYNIILCNSYDDPKKQAAYTRVLMEKRIDGLILVSSGIDLELTQLLADEAIPKVLVDREVPGVAADFIEADHEQGGYLATKYLLDLGHRRIACVSGPKTLLPSGDRVSGYLRALKEAGVDYNSDYLAHSDFTSQGGFSAFQQLLALPNRPTAIFASNDLMAIGGLCAAQQAGMRIPDELSVVGYDDIALASFSTPPLTTIAQPKYEIGVLTARVLVNRILNAELPFRREMLQTELIMRQSTGQAPA
ncbi:LacI family DNA-binding transcriptional regulator [Undibacterium sp. RTI2.1]|uniref:LacI family DNA-binding transcriptional regulator n=1 Tax=unclassified Undibacterium TaxID=2630295 RepID=UPI002AB53206|nr:MULTISPECIES: LacI family DNA-binding transcriptional regulator [unclassified Undibacterium]MDY7540589.1 LacI family DNA-binding transcriptional regulator [Undibacterium sp. 5I1]MEB0029747.1 LacI family DNA-binding transcriptional regulator [Undibacterium sp. RTI2.1]MEB0117461.1 LacI family DNA-binding transcriptional regulator [Undibacterium sp. RTI2.2]MEB0230766.1 LacI family DNA-binding transcriptional regulator [Undibacterium sp. 10I3]MEB0256555.1 LacI family DNA-binding transcriptional